MALWHSRLGKYRIVVEKEIVNWLACVPSMCIWATSNSSPVFHWGMLSGSVALLEPWLEKRWSALEVLVLVSCTCKLSISLAAVNCSLSSDTSMPCIPPMSQHRSLHLLCWKTHFLCLAWKRMRAEWWWFRICVLVMQKAVLKCSSNIALLKTLNKSLHFQDTTHKCQDAFEKPLNRTDSTYQSLRMLMETLRCPTLMPCFGQLTWMLLLPTTVFQKSFWVHVHRQTEVAIALFFWRQVCPAVHVCLYVFPAFLLHCLAVCLTCSHCYSFLSAALMFGRKVALKPFRCPTP